MSAATSRPDPARTTPVSTRRPAIPIAVGERFGEWEVLARAERADGNHSRWLCRCSCGKQRIIRGSSLRYGSGRCITCSRMAKPEDQRGGGRRPVHALLRDRTWLEEQYVAKQRTCQDIGLEVGCARRTVGKALSRWGIESRPPGSGYEAPEVVRVGERFGRLVIVARESAANATASASTCATATAEAPWSSCPSTVCAAAPRRAAGVFTAR
jgi:hypothetical protein